MDLNEVEKWLQGGDGDDEAMKLEQWEEALACKFFDAFTVKGIHVDLVQRGRLVCSMKVPPRLINDLGNFLHSGAVTSLVDLVGSAVFFSTGSPSSGVSIEISVSYLRPAYLHDEIEIEAKVLRMGKRVGVAMVELREKKTGKLIAQGRHAKYLAVSSKL
ncbi:uncharacterized protein A4U43_C10F8790 [Asparagus officinalis]|uniref:Acyl-coenzyme A thioesterase 13 n=1 Tax=Asparagus officinalis TaxID=4686 RepID=A0A5P1E4S1_ASPOF|nr:acyl-coenzyme A thioesterase 13-like [Asparagus officinalis]ONK56445.1 uncharacterized protein A4U43_C10F8790 [Asparagus officinalis]